MVNRFPFQAEGLLLCFVTFILMAVAASAQPPSATCDGNELLDGMDMTPVSISLSGSLSNDLSMTGTGCTERGLDHVTCFTPTNDCDLSFGCSETPESTATVAVNVYSGACTTAPVSCLGSTSGSEFASVFLSLSGGVQYCVVCESSASVGTLHLDFDHDGGSTCGALPVELISFEVAGGAQQRPFRPRMVGENPHDR